MNITNSSGTSLTINTYDEYGIPGSANSGRFQYTGQIWLPELGMYYYKARMYSPTLGRFMQTDPIGYGDGMNIYAYVGNDPVNFVDPSGLCSYVQYIDIVKVDGKWRRNDGDGDGRPDPPYYEREGADCANYGKFGRGGVSPYAPKGGEGGNATQLNTDVCDVARQLSNSNAKIQLYGVSFGGLGLGFATGNWKDLSTGYTGSFKTFMGGLGAPGSLAANGEIFRGSLTDFSTGYADTISLGISTPIGDLGYSSTSTFAGSKSRGFTLNLNKNPFKAKGVLPEAFVGHTETRIFDCKAPGS